jgi:hypothetical protein
MESEHEIAAETEMKPDVILEYSKRIGCSTEGREGNEERACSAVSQDSIPAGTGSLCPSLKPTKIQSPKVERSSISHPRNDFPNARIPFSLGISPENEPSSNLS